MNHNPSKGCQGKYGPSALECPGEVEISKELEDEDDSLEASLFEEVDLLLSSHPLHMGSYGRLNLIILFLKRGKDLQHEQYDEH